MYGGVCHEQCYNRRTADAHAPTRALLLDKHKYPGHLYIIFWWYYSLGFLPSTMAAYMTIIMQLTRPDCMCGARRSRTDTPTGFHRQSRRQYGLLFLGTFVHPRKPTGESNCPRTSCWDREHRNLPDLWAQLHRHYHNFAATIYRYFHNRGRAYWFWGFPQEELTWNRSQFLFSAAEKVCGEKIADGRLIPCLICICHKRKMTLWGGDCNDGRQESNAPLESWHQSSPCIHRDTSLVDSLAIILPVC